MKSINSKFVFIIIFIASAIITVMADNRSKLKLVNVVFRHGDRAPDTPELVPTDYNFENDFYPMGRGGLTLDGKRREYKLGQLLREMYKTFLLDVYLPDSVYAQSTYYPRTRMSLQLVLAGLFPPTAIQKWNDMIDWQPIPTTYLSKETDTIMIPEECLEYYVAYNENLHEPEVQGRIQRFQPLMDELTKATGKNVTRPLDLYMLYHLLVAESFMNLKLPSWSKAIFPYGELYEAIKLQYDLFSYTTELRRLNGGKLLYVIVEQMKSVINGSASENRQINLYSGHETNVAAMLQVLGVYKPHVPAYSSAVLIELHKNHSEYYVKVVYFRGIPLSFIVYTLPGCEVLCPFNQFLKLYKDVIPASDEISCEKVKYYD